MKNILIETISTSAASNLNYYFNERKYIDGVLSIEAGTKYILSKEKIDKIIVICSEETYAPEDDEKTIDILNGYNEQNEYLTKQRQSEFSKYKSRIAQFIDGNNLKAKTICEAIGNQNRREELINLVEEWMKHNGFDTIDSLFDSLFEVDRKFNSKEILDSLRSLIQSDIQKNFIKSEDYKQYDCELMDVYEIKELNKFLDIIDTRISEFRDEKRISILGKEILCLRNLGKIEKKIDELYQIRNNLEKVAYNETLTRLHDANRRFIEELRSLKERRLDNELAYVRWYLYDKLSDGKKMKVREDNKKLSIECVPLRICYKPIQKNSTKVNNENEYKDNIEGIIKAIRDDSNKIEAEDINLYIDVQGGNRTDNYVRSAALKIITDENNSNIKIKEIMATNYQFNIFASEIVDETKRYQISDLVSGMNAFVKYGKADAIRDYWNRVKPSEYESTRTEMLISIMENIDEAMSLCDIQGIKESLNSLRDYFENDNINFTKDEYLFEVLQDGIYKEYKFLIGDEELDIIKLIEWANRKKFYQQALTIIEALTPSMLVKDKIIFYCKGEEDKERVVRLFAKNERMVKDDENTEDTVDHLFIKKLYSSGPTSSAKAEGIIRKIKETIEENGEPQNSFGKRIVPVYMLNYEDSCHVERDNDVRKLLVLYFDLSRLRNENNHASRNEIRCNANDIQNKINDFIETYKNVKRRAENSSNAIIITISEVLNYINNLQENCKNDPQGSSLDRNIMNPQRSSFDSNIMNILNEYKDRLTIGKDLSIVRKNIESINGTNVKKILLEIMAFNSQNRNTLNQLLSYNNLSNAINEIANIYVNRNNSIDENRERIKTFIKSSIKETTIYIIERIIQHRKKMSFYNADITRYKNNCR